MEEARSRPLVAAKALEKANIAMRLDNGSDFEGAIAAYADACELIRQLTSVGGFDDENKKLDEIVC
jgi:hypothetical protein